MNQSKFSVIEKRVEKTVNNLKKNNMEAYYCKTREEAAQRVKSLIKPGNTVTCGGSATLFECGIIDLLKSGDYNYIDRFASGLTREQVLEIYRKAFISDVYLASSNAVTENGELYNVDGNSNRVAAIIYGPESVIIVAGYNKIVRNIDEAVKRVKTLAAPANAARLNMNTYCREKGECVSLAKGGDMCCGCDSEDRICCSYTVLSKQRQKNRIKVIIVGEELGF